MPKLKLLSAAAFSLAIISAPAYGATPDELQAQIEALKQQESAKNAEIAALRKKIKAIESSHAVNAQAPLRSQTARSAMAAAPLTPAMPSWAGFYVGAGYNRNQTKMNQGTSTTTSEAGGPVVTDLKSLDTIDFTHGGHILAGYMWQFNKFLLGVEGDYTFSQRAEWTQPVGLSNATCGVAFAGDFTCASVTPFGSLETIGHLRALAGFEFTPHVMGFVSGGAAFAKGRAGAHSNILVAVSPSVPLFTSADSWASNNFMVGYSLGAGIQVKMTENVQARIEYLHDVYDGITTGGSTIATSLGGHNTTITVPSEKVRITNDAIRGSLIYRFDDMSPRQTASTLWQQMTTAPGLYDNSWGGFYAGGGLTQNNYQVKQDGGITTTINDSNTPGVDYSITRDMERKDNITSRHLLLGYRLQLNRFLIGVEADWDYGAEKTLVGNSKSPGQFGGPTAPLDCFVQFQPNIVCLGGSMAGTQTFQSKGHVRLTGGVIITPELMVFGSTGWAYGRISGSMGGSADGFVFVPGNSPLVGAATVTRTLDPQNIRGRTIGLGFELKATPQISVRGEYYHDTYTWNHLPVGGAGFGGTTGNITVNHFVRVDDHQSISNTAYRISLIYRFWNPQQSWTQQYSWN